MSHTDAQQTEQRSGRFLAVDQFSRMQQSPLTTLHFAGHDIGSISTGNGMPLFSPHGLQWIQAQTGQDTDPLSLSYPLWKNQSEHEPLPVTQSPLRLPLRAVAESYLSTFTNQPLRFILPVVDPVLFKSTMDLAYGPERMLLGPTAEQTAARACVFSFLGFVALFHGQVDSAPIDSHATIAAAQNMLARSFMDCNIISVQICLIQVSSIPRESRRRAHR